MLKANNANITVGSFSWLATKLVTGLLRDQHFFWLAGRFEELGQR